ncbi:SDR family NAD(P)-dependent oxidoreductase [Chloroflexota bacterium]
MRLKNKVCIITGSGRGMGRAAALLFSREGASVTVAELQEDAGRDTADQIKKEGGKAEFVKVDVSNIQDVQEMVNFTTKHYGQLNVLFNNAGISGRPFGDGVKITDIPEEAWDKVLSVNLKSVFLCCKYCIPEIIKSGGGSIVNTSSLAGIIGGFPPGVLNSKVPLSNPHAYTAAKGGIISMSKAIAVAYGPDNVRCNVICPGVVDTELMKPTKFFEKEYKEATENYFPLRRYAKTEDIAYAALYLASDESSYITGQVLAVDGGYTAY